MLRLPLPSFTGDLRKDIILVPTRSASAKSLSPTPAIFPRHLRRSSVSELTPASRTHRRARGHHQHPHRSGRAGIELLFDAVEQSDLAQNTYLPTHCNRNGKVLDQMVRWAQMGGVIDLTTVRIIPEFVPGPEAVQYLLKKEVPLN